MSGGTSASVGSIARKVDTAMQPDMPESAIESGCVDLVLSSEDIAQKIMEIIHGDI